MIATPDTAARVRALTDLDETLLVEAAAGTGKTALIAGRMTMLLANGCEPSSLAAITFMEAAASELSARVHRYVHDLLDDKVPPSLNDALPDGLSTEQRKCLETARTRLDELTASTIHGFCYSLIRSYAVEVGVDPGARIIDAAAAEVAFDAVFDKWLRRRLTTVASADPIVVLSKEDPRQIVSTVRALARFRLEHRGARAVSADLSGRPDIEFWETVQDFRRWTSSAPAESGTESAVADLESLATFYRNAFESPPDFPALWRLAHPRRVASMRAGVFELNALQRKSAWKKVAGAEDGARLNDEAAALFANADAKYRTIHGKIATALVAALSGEIDEVLADYADFKSAAALLDFDDLLYRARELVVGHNDVRLALGEKYSRILVDEFQDTDPIQAEILFRIAAVDTKVHWDEGELRNGSLFMVGDPKQAIFRFRGADIETYSRARRAIERVAPQNIVHITASFRSQPDILTHVNHCFKDPLSADGQPGYVALTSTRQRASGTLPSVAKKTVTLSEELATNPRVADIRDAEARDVADICARLIGSMEIQADDGSSRLLVPADIALLAPAGTDLWRYERALEQLGVPFVSQAGKNLLGRQEIQDLLCLSRVLADPYDTLAFGALMRGPAVGLTERELLDITGNLQPIDGQHGRMPRFSVLTQPDAVTHPVAREALSILRDLRRRARSTTPALLLGEAIEQLGLRPLLAMRESDRGNGALANVDAFLELARGYGVRGLNQFASDMTRDWAERVPRREGRVDATGEAIEIVTMHSSKGLEWPVVILINTVTRFRPRDQFVHRPSDDTLHWVLGDVVPPELGVAFQSDEENNARERERLFYVAFTRARDLLVLPKVPTAEKKSWSYIVNDPHRDLPELDVSSFMLKRQPARSEGANDQTAQVFAEQQSAIEASRRKVRWFRPSQDDPDRVSTVDLLAPEADRDDVEIPIAVGAGRLRGLILHKLMEEVLSAEVADDLTSLVGRSTELLEQLAPTTDVRDLSPLPQAEELAVTVLRTLELPEIAALRHGLVSELVVFGTLQEEEAVLLSGRADAVFVEEEQARVVLDWKSDVAPSTTDVEGHAAQLLAYMRATRIDRGALVYMSTSRVHWLQL